jgi:uncharacterized membrane protein
MLIAFTVGIGFVAGLRTMTAPAVVVWAARLGWLKLVGTPFAFLAHPASLIIFSLLAVGELAADKLPSAPSRKSPGPFAARIWFGSLCGGALWMGAGAAGFVGLGLGAVGAVLGTVIGHALRTGIVRALDLPDLPVALLEDAIALGGGFWLASRAKQL